MFYDKAVSADSHITEPPNCYSDYIDPKFRDRAPTIVNDPKYGDVFVIEGLDRPVPMGLVAAAGQDPKSLKVSGAKFEDLHRSGWDPKHRIADQDRDGVVAEIIYPTVGMLLCNHPDYAFKRACFQAYNRWLAEYCDEDTKRLVGLGQSAVSSIEDTLQDLRDSKALGFAGVMMAGNPAEADYDHPMYDPVWELALELDLILSFHILTSKADDLSTQRGPKINSFQAIIRGCQDIMGTFIFGGVFDRFPNLKIVCVEADAGWVPHFMYRMDHAYNRHRFWMKAPQLKQMPSHYFQENIYLTFQDDWVAFATKDLMNVRRLMWANDFPHSDSTWPNSMELLEEHTKNLTQQEIDWVLRDNVAELYKLDLD